MDERKDRRTDVTKLIVVFRKFANASKNGTTNYCYSNTGVPLATDPGISLIILPLIRILQRNLKRTTDIFLFFYHTTNVLVFKFRCNILNGVRIIKEMPGSVARRTSCISERFYT